VKHRLFVLLTLTLLSLTLPSTASVFDEAERETGIPAEVLEAVARTESSMHPYAFAVYSLHPLPELTFYCSSRRFIRGKFLYNGCFLRTKKEAEKFLQFLLSSPYVSNFSMGLMQVNSVWLKSLEISPYTLLDPEVNVIVGALILKLYLEVEGGDYMRALSRYYGKKNGIAWKYVEKVVKQLRK